MKSSARAVKKVVKNEKKPKQVQRELGLFFHMKRKTAGMDAQILADHLEISQEHLAEYEMGLRKIPLHQIYAMTNFLNISPEEVVKLLHKTQHKS